MSWYDCIHGSEGWYFFVGFHKMLLCGRIVVIDSLVISIWFIIPGVLPPSLSAMVNSTASRYSVPGNIIKSPRRNSVDYIKSLSTQNSTKNDQVAAWTRSADFATWQIIADWLDKW